MALPATRDRRMPGSHQQGQRGARRRPPAGARPARDSLQDEHDAGDVTSARHVTFSRPASSYGCMEDVSLEIAWSAHRRRLLDIAYRMLGSLSDAEDVVQEAYARLARADRGAIDDLRSWLITVTGRLCLDHLRSADVKRRAYVGPWLPEPLVDFPGADADPADRVTLDDSLRMALLVLLEQLSPAERTAFVLHDIFQVPFDEVGAIVGRSPAACRQLAARARQHVQSETRTARFHIDATEQRRVAERFAAACNEGDLEALLKVLDPDVVGEFDSGGSTPWCSTHPHWKRRGGHPDRMALRTTRHLHRGTRQRRTWHRHHRRRPAPLRGGAQLPGRPHRPHSCHRQPRQALPRDPAHTERGLATAGGA